MRHRLRRSLLWKVGLTVAVTLVGLVGASSAVAEGPQSTEAVAAQQMDGADAPGIEQIEEHDPWEPYNEKMFAFNHDVFDRYLLKPVATAWDKVLPDRVKEGIANAFDNVGMPRRVINNALQGKFKGAGLELTRFVMNSTVGIAGFFDVAKAVGMTKRDADTGQTLGKYGVGPGPYLILPFLPPLDVRDAIGFAADVGMDPLNYVIPIVASVGSTAGQTVNTRAENLEFFESVEEATVDLYSAVRNAYLQRRQRAIQE